jgi:hypothetical protein
VRLTITYPLILVNRLIGIVKSTILSNTKISKVPAEKRILKPWVTEGVLRCIRLRNSMQSKLRFESHNNVLKITYKRFRNYCVSLLRKIKRQYNKKKIEDSTKNNKELWATINEISNFKAPKSSNSNLLNLLPHPIDSINRVNQFFVSVGRVLAENIIAQFGSQVIPVISPAPMQSSFVLLHTDPLEVDEILSGLDSNSAAGWDEISTKFVKKARDFLIPILSRLANLCFETGKFPVALKRSVVTPVHKAGDRGDVNNFRPISVLTCFSKILEKLLNKRLISFLTKYNLLSTTQYGFRKGLSTRDAVLHLTNIITEKVDNGDKCIAVFIDLKKAFDTISVPILVHRLEGMGIRGTPLSLFENYLQERTQVVKVGDYYSDEENVTYGVPQGSVLGPTLFLIYINELCMLRLNSGQIFSYADDTAVLFSGSCWETVRGAAESGLAGVAGWLNKNLLTLNTSKTKYICFSPSSRSQPETVFQIKMHRCGNINSLRCGCPFLEKVNSLKYLGVIVDQRLSWHCHIDLVIARVRKLMWIFKMLRHVMTNKLLNRIYVALAQSVITYCIPVWGGATKTKLLELERSQRSLIKIMYSKPWKYSTENLYKISNLLTVRKLYILNIVLIAHKNLPFDSSNLSNKRRHNVAPSGRIRTAFAERQYSAQSVFIYKIINKKFNIYCKKTYECKELVVEWLKTLNYEETEDILKRMM